MDRVPSRTAVTAFALVASALSGCTHPGRVLVVVGTDFQIPSEVQYVRLDVSGPDGEPWHRVYALEPTRDPGEPMAVDVPFSFVVRPRGGDATRKVRVDVALYETSAEAEARAAVPSARRTYRFVRGFVHNETRILPIHLSRACETRTCPFWCEYGVCSPTEVVDPRGLPRATNTSHEFDPLDAQVPTGDGAIDASVDAAESDDAGARDQDAQGLDRDAGTLNVDAHVLDPDAGTLNVTLFPRTDRVVVADALDGLGYVYVQESSSNPPALGRDLLPGASDPDYARRMDLAPNLTIYSIAVDPSDRMKVGLVVQPRTGSGYFQIRSLDGTVVSTNIVTTSPGTHLLAMGLLHSVVATENGVVTDGDGSFETRMLSRPGVANGVWAAATSTGTERVALALHHWSGQIVLTAITHGMPGGMSSAPISGSGGFSVNDACLGGTSWPTDLWLAANDGSTDVVAHLATGGELVSIPLAPTGNPGVSAIACLGETPGGSVRLLLGGTYGAPPASWPLPHAMMMSHAWVGQFDCSLSAGTCTYVPGSAVTAECSSGAALSQIIWSARGAFGLFSVDGTLTIRRDIRGTVSVESRTIGPPGYALIQAPSPSP